MATLARPEGANIVAPVGYYAYIIGDDGHIVNRVAIVCEDDEEATRCAKLLVNGHDVELWQEARKVATFQHKR